MSHKVGHQSSDFRKPMLDQAHSEDRAKFIDTGHYILSQ